MARGHEEGLAFNRRFRYRDGREQFGIRGDGSDVVGPAGPTDPELGLIAFRAGSGADPFAIVCNYSLHIDVTGGTLISADYPAVMTDVLRRTYGPELIVLFVQGACGNINHVPYLLDRPWPRKGVERSQQIGRALAGKVLCLSEKSLPSADTGVDAAVEMLSVASYPLDEVVAMRLAEARAVAEPNAFEKRLLELARDLRSERHEFP